MYEELKQFVKKYLEKYNEEYNLLERCAIKEEGEKQVYFGWDSLKWDEGYYREVDAIMEALRYLSENGYSYRYSRMGEDYEDYEEQYNNGEKDNEEDLEFPCLIRQFDDEYVLSSIKDLSEIDLNNKEKDKEETYI